MSLDKKRYEAQRWLETARMGVLSFPSRRWLPFDVEDEGDFQKGFPCRVATPRLTKAV
jgi:hypothetical protein